MVNWGGDEALRKRITRQRSRLVLKIKSFGLNLNKEEISEKFRLQKELDELEAKYFTPGREATRKYYTPKGSNVLIDNWLKGKLTRTDKIDPTKHISRASETAERVAVFRYRHGLTLNEEQMRIIKYLRLTKSRYSFDKFTWKR